MPEKHSRTFTIDLCGTIEASVILRVTVQRVSQLIKEDSDFPEPFAYLGGKTPLFLTDDIRQYNIVREEKHSKI